MRRVKSTGSSLLTCDNVDDTNGVDSRGIPKSSSSYLSLNEIIQGQTKVKHPRSRVDKRPLTSSLTIPSVIVIDTPRDNRYSIERSGARLRRHHIIRSDISPTTTALSVEDHQMIDGQAIGWNDASQKDQSESLKECVESGDRPNIIRSDISPTTTALSVEDHQMIDGQAIGWNDASQKDQSESLKECVESGDRPNVLDETADLRQKLESAFARNNEYERASQQEIRTLRAENQCLKENLIDIEEQLKILTEEKFKISAQLSETESAYNDLKRTIVVSCLDGDLDIVNFERSNESIRQLVLQFVNKYRQQQAMNEQHEERIRSLEENAKKTEDETKQLFEALQSNKQQQNENEDIKLMARDDVLRGETQWGRNDINSISELLRRREEDLERYQIDLRATRTKATEMEVQSAHTKILLEAAETESKAFKETLAMLLSDDFTTFAATEENIKKRVRQIMSERRDRAREKAEDDRRIENLEQRCAEQARNHRLAIAHARTIESDINTLKERFEGVNRELSSVEIERSALEKREKLHFLFIDKLVMAMRLDELRSDLNVEIDEETLLARAEQLTETEIDYIRISGITQNDLLTRHLREAKRELDLKAMQLDVLRKKMRITECADSMRKVHSSVSKLDELNRTLLTKLTLQQIKSNDSEKRLMKHRLEEQSRLIRELEKKAKEIDRLRNFFDKKDRQSLCCLNVDCPQLSKNPGVHLQQLKVRLADVQRKEAQLCYFRSRVIEVLSMQEDVSDVQIIKRIQELISKSEGDPMLDHDAKPTSLVRRTQSSDSISRPLQHHPDTTNKKFPAIGTPKSRPKTTFIKWK
ncbi:Uncharacterized protein C27D6.1 [Toxocara canis]|uniref:Uncharacterized protein C27D6.1 n=1 Tax=Toxocara canis TaxID=6265 RepID=A0A0B2V1T9_TOXCA|nr:Uncharacterized protein C27D6.1 [Toxocara canis]